MTDLIWYEELDDDELTEWSAASIYHDDGSHFMFRIKEQAIGSGPCVTYHETSDAELMFQAPRTWESLQVAKDTLQAEHEAMITAERAPGGAA
ncbi:hypothetical protein [Tabrizicola sp.]|uniref:hypothetical protein n=1 Tax=Tabrizicola sp. TaxID=2005166 RepID=UPI003F2F82E0